jgi:tRNA A22 N-methylase
MELLKELYPECYRNLRTWLQSFECKEMPETLVDETFSLDRVLHEEENNNLRDSLLLQMLLTEFYGGSVTRREMRIETTHSDGFHILIDTNDVHLIYAGGIGTSITHSIINALIEHIRLLKDKIKMEK